MTAPLPLSPTLQQLHTTVAAKLPHITVGAHPYDIGYWSRRVVVS